ncbi:ATP-binding cassette domain-containing protein [Microbacterium paludicola]|uniref:ATP-binding cassette domain-containing protein n=1 Tax=Microbacterium paludicola TaxID=300019 RepID=A0A4Y9FUA6_9MICO|nr:oligopeptide/dipeptide ABC transporter ATP-binding protein [Microbacterium paludicola]MBF0817167.1 ATP-binding cassette domain-containing protein [Microbacterium paludicola]TFU32095.1 ATP-binding cassette domain-containing protein [Microbacterium paludicola]
MTIETAQRETATERDPVLVVDGLGKTYSRRADGYRVLKDVSFQVLPGETLGIVGESGCGKSTLARAIMRLGGISEGSVTLGGTELSAARGRALRRLRRRFQMVFQDPFGSLDPRMTVLEIVEQPLRTHRVGDRGERRERAREVLQALGLGEDFWQRVPSQLSGGQRQRVAIARAIVLRPDITVLDEPISALDVSVQAQVLNLLKKEQKALGLTYVFIAHDLAVAEYFADRVLVLYLGQVVEEAPAEELFANPQHPYTVALFSAAPDPRAADRKRRITLAGEPQARRPDQGCPFAPRCPVGRDREKCRTEAPGLQPLATDGHRAACHYPAELRP